MKTRNHFINLLMGYNRALSTEAPKIPTFIVVLSLVIYHLQRLGVFLISRRGNIVMGTTVNLAVSQIIKMFQIQYWTVITPLKPGGIVIMIFSIIMTAIFLRIWFFSLVFMKRPIPKILQKIVVYLDLIFDKHYLFIPVLESSFYIFSLPAPTKVALVLASFNLGWFLLYRACEMLFSYRNYYTNLKPMARTFIGDIIDIIGFIIMLSTATRTLNNNIPAALGIALTCFQLLALIVKPKFIGGIQNQVENVSQSFCLAFGIDILLQNMVYHNSDFPFFLIFAFIYWTLRSLIQYRFWYLVRLYENPTYTSSMMKNLPYIFDEYQNHNGLDGKFLDTIYPILAHQSNLAASNPDKKKGLDEMIFTEKANAFEHNSHKKKTSQAFINFLNTTYEEYLQSTDVTKQGVQAIMVAYPFFVKLIVKDHHKTLVLIQDFRVKLKKAQLRMGLRERIQTLLIEEECVKEAITSKGKSTLDTDKVFSVLDQTEELKRRMIDFIEKKIAFLECFKAPSLDLALMKSQGITLTQESQNIVKIATSNTELSQYIQFKNLFRFFAKEILQDSKILGIEFKNTLSYRVIKQGLKDISATELIEKIQNNSASRTFILAMDDCTVNRGRIVRYTKELRTQLNYSQEEISGLHFNDIVAIVNNETYHTYEGGGTTIERPQDDPDRKMHQIILKNRDGDLVSAQGVIQHQIFQEIPCLVLFGEEDKSTPEYFMLCQRGGIIQGLSAKLASYIKNYNKCKGKPIHQVLYERHSTITLEDEPKRRKNGYLKLKSASDLNEEIIDTDFAICPLGNDNTDSKTFDGYLVYLYPIKMEGGIRGVERGSLDVVKLPSSKSPTKIQRSPTVKFKDDLQIFQMESTIRQDSDNTFEKRLESDYIFEKRQDSDNLPTENEVQAFHTKSIDTYNGTQGPMITYSVSLTNRPSITNRQSITNRPMLSSYTNKLKPITTGVKPSEARNDTYPDFTITDNQSEIENTPPKNSVSEFEEKVKIEERPWKKKEKVGDTGTYASSIHSNSRRRRKLEEARHMLSRHSLPIIIQWMRILQILACLTILGYLIGDYLDLNRRFEILAHLSGITAFPSNLVMILYAYAYTAHTVSTIFQGLWPANLLGILLGLVAYDSILFFVLFIVLDRQYVFQTHPSTYYSDFSYSNYAMNLTFAESPYLNRVVPFHEAINALRGYFSNFFYSLFTKLTVNTDALNFFSEQKLNFETIFTALSDDLFTRLTGEFDNLLELLKSRVLVGLAAALTIGSTTLFIFQKLHRSTENLLSKFAKIPESDLADELTSLREKLAYLKEQSGETATERKAETVPKPLVKKKTSSYTATSKKYKPLPRRVGLQVCLAFLYSVLFMIPFIVGFFIKKAPVSSCIPLISQYKLITEMGASAAAINAHFMEAVATAGTGNSTGVLKILNETEAYIEEAKAYSNQLYDMLNNIDSLSTDPFVSQNLSSMLLHLRNATFCSTFPDALGQFLCQAYNTTMSAQLGLGVTAMFQTGIQYLSMYRGQLRTSPTRTSVLLMTYLDPAFAYNIFIPTLVHSALTSVMLSYQRNFEDVAAKTHRQFEILLIVSIVYYCILAFVVLVPLVPWARRQYNKAKNIYTLLPADVLITNPYIKTVLKSR